jgi:hypothetical protein
MSTSAVRVHNGIPSLFLDDRRVAPIVAYVRPRFADAFRRAGIELYTTTVPGVWWIGPERYDWTAIDTFIGDYVARIPEGLLMPRIYLGQQGFPWWGAAHPDEMNVLCDAESGQILDPLIPNPIAASYLGHELRLEGLNLHSFHSLTWRQDAGRAVAALIAHCEAAPYADRIWGWHLCDGLFQEWFHWSEYAFGALADYSPAAVRDFRRWLRRTYGDDPQNLARAWGRAVHLDEVTIPSPQERSRVTHGEFYDPVRDRPTIDYVRCFSGATVDSITAICRAVKEALPRPKVTCVFYGYQFSDMPRPQLNAHYALGRLLASPEIDLVASPHAYCNRGEGGYHSPQCVADAVRRAGKIHFDESDSKTVWTPPTVTWKRHISQPGSVEATIEMMKKDAAYHLASATGIWWMDLTDEGWFDDPAAVEPIRQLKAIAERLETVRRDHFGEIALVVSQEAMPFQAPRAGLHNATLLMFRNWHLSRIGAPFEQLLIEDLARPDLPAFKLYIMANLFYLSDEQRALVDRVVKRDGATVLWICAPGFVSDRSAALENMQALTGIQFVKSDLWAELNVALTDRQHPVTRGLPHDLEYGTGIDREQYRRPPKIEYLPDTAVSPAFWADDDRAHVLGIAQSTGQPGLVYKDMGDWRSIYSAAPLLPWPLLRNIAQHAGAHIYDDQGDMIWANNAFLALYAQGLGARTVRFPHPVTVEDAYSGQSLGTDIQALDLYMGKWETRLFYLT